MRTKESRLVKVIACFVAMSVLSAGLSGCIIPEAAPILGHERKKRILHDVIRGVQCEIRNAVRMQIFGDGKTRRGDRNGENGKRKLQWFEKWNSLITLTLRIDDTLEFNPGVSLKTPNWINARVKIADFDEPVRIVPQNYSFGIGGGVRYETSREDVVTFAYPFAQFIDDKDRQSENQCYNIAGFAIESDLKIDDWIDDVLEPIKKCAFLGRPPGYDDSGALPFSTKTITASDECFNTEFQSDPITTITHEIDFVLSFNASVTPTWNLVRVSTTDGKLFGGGRTDTSRLLISFGPPKDGVSGLAKIGASRSRKTPAFAAYAAAISPEMLYQHNAFVTGNAVSDALRR